MRISAAAASDPETDTAEEPFETARLESAEFVATLAFALFAAYLRPSLLPARGSEAPGMNCPQVLAVAQS